MKKTFAFMALALMLSACGAPAEVEKPAPLAPGTYDQNSWRTMVGDSCQSFFDGCNNCNRAAGTNLTACTKKFCETYEKPECLDEVDVEIY